MKNNRLMTKKLFLCFVAAFFLALFSFGVYTLTSRLSLAASSGWDGVTVATEFARGNGTAENPYIIENGPELMYFKQILEGFLPLLFFFSFSCSKISFSFFSRLLSWINFNNDSNRF